MAKRASKLVSLPRLWLTALAAIVILCSSLTVAQPTDPPPPRPTPEEGQKQEAIKQQQQQESFARKMAEQLLDGREVLVRVYNDWQHDFRAYKLVSVKLKGLTVSFDDIKSAYGQMAQSLFPVVFGLDQTDKIVAAVLGNYVCAEVCRPGNLMYLWPPFLRDPKFDQWVFVDALGNPIPGASVEVLVQRWNLIGNNPECMTASICKATLDQNGCMKRFRRMDTTTNFTFIVSAPNYGSARVACASSRSFEETPQSYVVPLAPLDSQAAERAVSGFIVDPQGNAVIGTEINCHMLRGLSGQQLHLYTEFLGTHLTDSRGWFSIYMPINEDGHLSRTLLPAMTEYHLSIVPPKGLHLFQSDEVIIAGTQETIVLNAMEPNEYFHTFAFEDYNNPLTDEELKRITITLYRDGRGWTSLKYDDWKNGCNLPAGILIASMSRWHFQYHFEQIELTPDSPQELVFKAGDPIVYTGKVVNGATGQPMPNVVVIADPVHSEKDASSMNPQQWEIVRSRLIANPNGGPSTSPLHNFWDRVTVTDANGFYQITFIPGLSTRLGQFWAMERGYDMAMPPYVNHLNPNARGIIQVQTITLTPSTPPEPKLQKPTFVFENESGPVTDPNALKYVRLEMGPYKWTYSGWMQDARFIPGTYQASANWNGKYYIFEPVEVIEESPQTVVFKIKQIHTNNITYRGQVVNGITGAPMPGTIVMMRSAGFYGDTSGLQPQQWQEIYSAGPQLDPNDLAFAPLKKIFEFTKIVRADTNGWFQLVLGPGTIDEDDEIVAIAKDYIAAKQYLDSDYVQVEDLQTGLRRFTTKKIEPDQNGNVALRPMKLFPAATIIIEPHIPNVSSRTDHRLRFQWFTAPDDTIPLKTALEDANIWLFYKWELQHGRIQTAYIPAGLPLTIEVYPMLDQWGPAKLGEIELQQGQTINLGSVSFPRTFQVAVKVINSQGQPVPKVTVRCRDEIFRASYIRPTWTEEDGIAWIYVSPNSKGQFVVEARDTVNQTVLRESFPYQVAGPEDEGKEFTLMLSDQMLEQLFKENRPR
jgi:hypothetical protein